MGYWVLLRFNSMQNATNFTNRAVNYPLQPEVVSVPSGYTSPPAIVGSPGSLSPTSPNWVMISVDTLSQIPQGYSPMWTYDYTNKVTLPEYTSPNIDPNNLTVMGGPTGDQTIILHGIPSTNMTDQLPPPGPIDFQPIYYDPVRDPTQPQLHGDPLPPPINLFDPNLPDIMPINKYQQWLVPTDMQPDPLPGDTVVDPPRYRQGLPEPLPPGIDSDIQDPIAIDPRSYETQQQFLPFEMWPLNRPSPEPKVKPPQASKRPTLISDSGEGGGTAVQTGSTWFAIAGFDSSLALARTKIYRSTNALAWAETDLTQYFNFIPSVPVAPVPFFSFRNGVGIITGTSNVNSQVAWRALATFNGGLTWQLVASTLPPQSIGTPTFANNAWSIPIVGGSPVSVPVPWSAGTYPNPQDGDNVGNIPVAQNLQIIPAFPDVNTNQIQRTTDGGVTLQTTLTVTSPNGMWAWYLMYQNFTVFSTV